MTGTLTMTLVLLWMGQCRAMVAYDCGSNAMNITTVSLLSVGECSVPDVTPNITKVHVQLLQLAEFTNTRVIQCKIEIDRTVFHCGMHSHVSIVNNGRMEYIMDVSYEKCERIHATKALNLGFNTYIDGLIINQTTSWGATLAGTIGNSGECNGVQYADYYGSWNDVVVQAKIKATLQEYYAQVQLSSNSVVLRTGVRCALTAGTCMDTEGGNTFWNAVPSDTCRFAKYDVLYEGIASKFRDENVFTESPIADVYTVSTPDLTFALTKTGQELLCGYVLIKTEHPRLFIMEVPKGDTFVKKNSIATENLDLFSYVNSKFVYVERHIRTQLTMLYRDVLHQRCLLETDLLKNTLALATLSPDEFAFNVMKGPGYMAVTAGEVIHIIKCIPVEVKVRTTEECYQNLPVYRGNQSFFIFPKTHVLVNKAVQVDCNPFIPPMYHINDQWYKFLPHATETRDPTVMQPVDAPTWKYSNPGALASSGIYSMQDLNKLRDRIMFPAELPAIVNTIARGTTGQITDKQGVSISYLLDEATLNSIVQSTWDKMWGWATGFGTMSAGLLGIIMIFRLIKFSVDTFIHGYALHNVYGWSIHLIFAIWDSVTTFLLHMAKSSDQDKSLIKTDSIDIEAQETPVVPSAPSMEPSMYPKLHGRNNVNPPRTASMCSCTDCD